MADERARGLYAVAFAIMLLAGAVLVHGWMTRPIPSVPPPVVDQIVGAQSGRGDQPNRAEGIAE